MTLRRLLIGFAVASVLTASALVGGILRESADAGGTPARASQDRLEAGFSAGDTEAFVAQVQRALRSRPGEANGYALLGLAYQQRARETGDPAYYTKSAGVLLRALRLAPRNLVATGALASLELSRHRFGAALRLGRRAQTISPTTARNYGVIGDALVELGRYREAFAAFDRMVRYRPSLASYARFSYERELLGDRRGAIRWMRLALDTARGQPEPLAWTHVQLGKLFWASGRVNAAAREYRAALAAFPGYVYAYDALAQVAAARGPGHLAHAIALEREAVARIPLPQFVATLGDLYARVGRPRLARAQYATIGVIQRLLEANGVRTDLEIALFNVDRGISVREALELARRAHRARPSIDGDDVLAWALYRNGRCGEALAYSRHSLRLGTRDALKEFHRGMIERCLGHNHAGADWLRRALTTNPNFSLLWAPVARRALT
jgi:tetratricopeptide (TPR) repeat protein